MGLGEEDGHCSIWYVGTGGSHTSALGKWHERDCTYPSVASSPHPGAGWLMPAALPTVFPASGAHPGPAQVCSDSGSCCGAWYLCGPSPCLVPGPFPFPYPCHAPPCHAPGPSLSPGPALGCALAASLAPAVGSAPAPLPSPAPFALLLLAPSAASPVPWPVQPSLPPSEQSAAGRKGNRHFSPAHISPAFVYLHLDQALLAQGHRWLCC